MVNMFVSRDFLKDPKYKEKKGPICSYARDLVKQGVSRDTMLYIGESETKWDFKAQVGWLADRTIKEWQTPHFAKYTKPNLKIA